MLWDLGDIQDTWEDAKKEINKAVTAKAIELGITK